jgi:hypothetical protein
LFTASGFNEAKITKFGNDFLSHITKFCQEHNLKMDNFPEDSSSSTLPEVASTQPVPSTSKSQPVPVTAVPNKVNVHNRMAPPNWEELLTSTNRESYSLFQIEKLPIEDISMLRYKNLFLKLFILEIFETATHSFVLVNNFAMPIIKK